MDKCPKCNSEEIMADDGGFDRDRMVSWSTWHCANCGEEWSEVEDVDDDQIEYDDMGMFSYVKPKTRPEDV